MLIRAMNFNPGPAALPLAALKRAQEELVEFAGTGMSIMEHSHRGAAYEGVHREALALLRQCLEVPDTHEILLLQGGARQQFAMVPMNFLLEGKSADYAVTGTWGQQALAEAQILGRARAINSRMEAPFLKIPEPSELSHDREAAYLHLTSNNTLFGTQWSEFPDTKGVPLVADMTSDLLSRAIDVSKFDLIYAGAQKNLGPAGVTVVIVSKRLLERAREDIPRVFRYGSFVAKNSLWNTPPTFAIYMLRNTLAAYLDEGGIEALYEANRVKASKVYALIDSRPDFFLTTVDKGSRSGANAVFRLGSEALEADFLREAEAEGMVGLKGHRAVGGIRISMYNGVEPRWIDHLVGFMLSFANEHG